MYDINQQWTDSDLVKFEIIALGCHFKMQEVMRMFLRESYGIEAFQIVEYFLLEPVIRNDEMPGDTFFPFIRRLLDQNVFHFKGKKVIPLNRNFREDIEFQKEGENLRPRRFCLPFENTIVGKKIYKLWINNENFESITPEKWVEKYLESNWIEHTRGAKELEDIEQNLLVHTWENCSEEYTIKVGGYPIASNNIFYGYFIVIWPEPAEVNTSKWGNVELKEIFQTLQNFSNDYYLPTLIILHNYFCEERISKYITKDVNENDLINFIKTFPLSNKGAEYNNEIEKGFALLWEKRKNLLESKIEKKIDVLKNSLLFREYNIASPGMIEQVRKIMQRAPHLQQPKIGKKLPTALIYGEAGSGKDTMAKLIQLFTEVSWSSNISTKNDADEHMGYFGIKPRVVNIAALKPNALFGPLFLGLHLKDHDWTNIPSILARYKDPTIINNIGISEEKAVIEEPGVYILDELNSLDLDLQGILLRIIENGEVTPLFDVNPHFIKHLIIGIVNEDPEMLTREYETKNLTRIKEFTGEFIGNILYELLTKGRRLRPDLYYRLKRGLFIKIPSLKNRREDIPILFYFECENAVFQELKTNSDLSIDEIKHKFFVHIELRAFETLMSPAIDWPGNIRQLQSIATEVAINSVSNHRGLCRESEYSKKYIVSITDLEIREILSIYFPGIIEKPIYQTFRKESRNGYKRNY